MSAAFYFQQLMSLCTGTNYDNNYTQNVERTAISLTFSFTKPSQKIHFKTSKQCPHT